MATVLAHEVPDATSIVAPVVIVRDDHCAKHIENINPRLAFHPPPTPVHVFMHQLYPKKNTF